MAEPSAEGVAFVSVAVAAGEGAARRADSAKISEDDGDGSVGAPFFVPPLSAIWAAAVNASSSAAALKKWLNVARKSGEMGQKPPQDRERIEWRKTFCGGF